MHTNHRRKKGRHTKRHGGGCFLCIYSMKEMRKQKARDRRAEERRLIHHERWDDLPTHYPKNIIWEYW